MVERFESKAGTFDTLVDADGDEHEIFIIEDSPAFMTVRLVDCGATLYLAKEQ